MYKKEFNKKIDYYPKRNWTEILLTKMINNAKFSSEDKKYLNKLN